MVRDRLTDIDRITIPHDIIIQNGIEEMSFREVLIRVASSVLTATDSCAPVVAGLLDLILKLGDNRRELALSFPTIASKRFDQLTFADDGSEILRHGYARRVSSVTQVEMPKFAGHESLIL